MTLSLPTTIVVFYPRPWACFVVYKKIIRKFRVMVVEMAACKRVFHLVTRVGLLRMLPINLKSENFEIYEKILNATLYN